MQHVVDTASTTDATGTAVQQPAAMILHANSQSTTSSPKSAKASIENSTSQISEAAQSSNKADELTPPSSVASTQEQHEIDRQLAEENRRRDIATSPITIGKKRTANGLVKEMGGLEQINSVTEDGTQIHTADSVSMGASPNLTDLSQQLKTRLTYAMVKVQNGWQKHSIDEVESLASQSPRSTLSTAISRDRRNTLSPRTSLAIHRQMNENDRRGHSGSSGQIVPQQAHMAGTANHFVSNTSVIASPVRKLAPPASITPGPRRRPAPNVSLQINSSVNPSPRSNRPATTQRTPSQNAAMEADAVETLMFMSASPNNSGHFPSHLSAYSPASQVFSAQTSPLKSQFPSNVAGYSPPTSNRRRRYEDKADLIDRLLNNLDDDESEELDRAMKIMEQHRAAKLSA